MRGLGDKGLGRKVHGSGFRVDGIRESSLLECCLRRDRLGTAPAQ